MPRARRRSRVAGHATQTGRQKRDRSGRRIAGRFQMNRPRVSKVVMAKATKRALGPRTLEDKFGF